MRAIFLGSSLITTTASAQNSAPSTFDIHRGPIELGGRSETQGTLRKALSAPARAHSREFETKSEKNKNLQGTNVDLLGELYVETMKTK